MNKTEIKNRLDEIAKQADNTSGLSTMSGNLIVVCVDCGKSEQVCVGESEYFDVDNEILSILCDECIENSTERGDG